MSYVARVRAIPRRFDADHVRHNGENVFCDHASLRDDVKEDCSGTPEVEIGIANVWDGRQNRTIAVFLCRTHATEIAEQMLDAVKMVDGRDLMEMT